MRSVLIAVICSILVGCYQVEDLKARYPVLESLPKPTQHYAQGVEDLPLYHGFELAESGTLAYDTMDGRIVEATYERSKVSIKEIKAFYQEALPQLGWQALEELRYERDGELLELNLSQIDDKTQLKILVKPFKNAV